MDEKTVTKAIIDVISKMEASFGHAPPVLGSADVPEEKCVEFDSKMWTVAITRIARTLSVSIPKDVAVFGRRNGAGITIAESARKICKAAQPKPQFLQAAE
ncbi:hypothetical protein [Aureimonas sp. N4]|uniref:hypothetical protein n=1 Tax=Aureimonas sp. N4 TaxID=1638165 RepID=UPI0012E3A607|nr:hypothetical protein [Aureimonas sp. N4]